MRFSSLCHNERGAVLVTGLIFMAILSILGTSAYLSSSNELLISKNYKTASTALYAAEAGIEEARGRLRGSNSDANFAGDPDSSPDTWWSAYILTSSSWTTADDPNYDGNYENYIPTTSNHTNTTIVDSSLQTDTDISYSVKIKYKTEYDAEQNGHTTSNTHYYDDDGDTSTHTAASPGNMIYWGYGNPATPTTKVQFTTSGATEHEPVKIIASQGTSANSARVIEVEVVNNPGPPIKSAVYAKGDVTGNGSSLSVDGTDNCGSADSKPPIYTLDPSTTTLNGTPTMSGDPAAPETGTNDVDIDSYVNSLKGSADDTITSDQNGVTYGNASTFRTCYSNTSDPANVNGLKLQNTTGYGILLVEGDLTLGGGFTWNGIILCTGTLTFNGGGSGINILGAVLANQTVDINGDIDIKYDSCMVSNSLNGQGVDTISWKID